MRIINPLNFVNFLRTINRARYKNGDWFVFAPESIKDLFDEI